MPRRVASPSAQPYLSVVVTSRSDEHGGDPVMRLQAFINCFDAQCRRAELDAELIVVEWNPPSEKPRLQSLVRIPDPCSCTYRFLDVPPELHRTLQYSDVLPLFQMIAKNVGIRRARGRFVLATNIDIIFSNELIDYIASGQLEAGYMYRVDRHDIQSAFPVDAPLDAQMAYCADHHLRIHARWGSYTVDATGGMVHTLDDIVSGPAVALGSGWHVREGTPTSGFYRWATDRVQLCLDAAADPSLAGSQTVLDIELEPNPYDSGSWVEIEGVDQSGTVLARCRISRRVVLRIELDQSVERRTVELRVVATPSQARRGLAVFERRGAMHYRVRSISVKRRDPERAQPRFVYPAAGWHLMPGARLADPQPTDGLSVVTDSRRWSYCLEYGPLCAPVTGTYRFAITCELAEGGVSLGVMKSDRRSWLPSSKSELTTADGYSITTSVELASGDMFLLVVSNDHPSGEGRSRLAIKALTGSIDVSQLQQARTLTRRWQTALADLRRLVATKERSSEGSR